MSSMSSSMSASAKLPKRLLDEWSYVNNVNKNYVHKMTYVTADEQDFKKYWNNFQGELVEEFLNFPSAVYVQWIRWRNELTTSIQAKTKSKQTLNHVLTEFKNFWEFDKPVSKVMFKEIELLSENMLSEWRYNVYEYEDCICTDDQFEYKSKAQLWLEFKEFWEIDVLNYNENKFNKSQ